MNPNRPSQYRQIQLNSVENKVLADVLGQISVEGFAEHPYLHKPAQASYNGLDRVWDIDVTDEEGNHHWSARIDVTNPPWSSLGESQVAFRGNVDLFRRDLMLARSLYIPHSYADQPEPA